MRNFHLPRSFDFMSESLQSLEARSPGSYTFGPRSVVAAVLLLTANCLVGSYEEALAWVHGNWAALLDWEGRKTPTKGGLSKARLDVSPEVFFELWQQQAAYARSINNLPSLGLPEDRPYISVDATWLVLPDSEGVRRRWKQANIDPQVAPQMCMVTAVDICQRLPVAATVSGKDRGERQAALEMLDSLDARSVLLLDRGYPGREFLGTVMGSGRDFCVRMLVGPGAFPEVNAFWNSDQDDALVEVDVGTSGTQVLRMVRRRFPAGRPKKGAKRERMVVMTTLIDDDIYSSQHILDLYKARWEVETFFREVKTALEIESFHSKDPDGIMQEVYAIMMWMTVAAIMEQDANRLIAEQHGSQRWNDPKRICINRIQMGRAIRRSTPAILSPSEEIRSLAKQTIIEELRRLVRQAQRKRPGRSAPRKRKRPFGR